MASGIGTIETSTAFKRANSKAALNKIRSISSMNDQIQDIVSFLLKRPFINVFVVSLLCRKEELTPPWLWIKTPELKTRQTCLVSPPVQPWRLLSSRGCLLTEPMTSPSTPRSLRRPLVAKRIIMGLLRNQHNKGVHKPAILPTIISFLTTTALAKMSHAMLRAPQPHEAPSEMPFRRV